MNHSDIPETMMRIVVRQGTEAEIAALPRASEAVRDDTKPVIDMPHLVVVEQNGNIHQYLAGYVGPAKVRMTSEVVGYDAERLLVRTRNSTYKVNEPLVAHLFPDRLVMMAAAQALLTSMGLIIQRDGEAEPTAPSRPTLH